jgi:hydrogenase maturation protein HypF
MMPATRESRALRARVEGVVQGVGFRPFVHRLATRLELAGSVLNSAGDVEVHVEGREENLRAFVRALRREAPPLARIDAVETEPAPVLGLGGFTILPSVDNPDRRQPVSPDVALCAACEQELFDPGNRRYQYPFITCTDCGPRFTVIDAMPYDRERTSMRVFAQCPACAEEYRSPGNRRFHSETNSCATCGPRVWLEDQDGGPLADNASAIGVAAELLLSGAILAIRGLGGFHLAVDATNDAAVRQLRARKQREEKPLAIMVRSVADVAAFARCSPTERRLLASPERPIVILRKRRDGRSQLAPSVAPGLAHIGVVLAYTPLHHLLLDAVKRPLVMTSGNLSEEPIAIHNDEARLRLAGIADAMLLHDRGIVARYDDSVVRAVGRHTIMIRRARGYAPLPLELPVASPVPLLAVGAHLKNTFTLAHGARAYVSQHIGDLENYETLEHFRDALSRYESLFRIRPEGVVHDLHPAYLSTRIALELKWPLTIAVQHHHAHVAAVLAEHQRTGPVIGVAYDGTGYGDDGATWGAEILHADLTGYRRLGHLRYSPLPGGDAASRNPWRSALGFGSLAPAAEAAFRLATTGIDPETVTVVERQLVRRVNAPMASSMGRLFDAAAAVLGVRRHARFEGQAAMELEALAGARPASPLPWSVEVDADGLSIFDPLPLLIAMGEARQLGVATDDLAAAFHESVVEATVEMVRLAAESTGCHTVVLGGGCFQNARLLTRLRNRLDSMRLEVLVPRRLGPNDGAISFGQAAVASALLHREREGGLRAVAPARLTYGNGIEAHSAAAPIGAVVSSSTSL